MTSRRGYRPPRGEPATGAGRGSRRHPDYEPGNLVGLRHGAHSPQLVRNDADQLLAEIEAEDPPWLGHVDRAALDAWLYSEATCRRLRAWLDEHGHLHDDGKPRSASTLLITWERRAADQRGRLGFDPLSRARLGRDTAVAQAATADALEALRTRGREVVEVRRRAELAAGSESDIVDPDLSETLGGPT